MERSYTASRDTDRCYTAKSSGDNLVSELIGPQRDTLLISHANPEDNEFSLWLALQLANHGYRVWCDLTKLLGGEVFWDNIEEVIRNSAAKVLYVLTRTSNTKDGPLRELQVAQGVARKEKLKDFVVPLHIDDLPHGEVTIELSRLNSIPFRGSWAHGLDQLLKKLSEDLIPRSHHFNPEAVNQWWRTQFSSETGVARQPERYFSNWFLIEQLPEHVYLHVLGRKGIGKIEIAEKPPYPAFQDGITLVTFARASDFENKLGSEIYIAQESEPRTLKELLEKKDFGRALSQLLRLAWEQALNERKLPVYELANEVKSFYFPLKFVPGDRLYFQGVDGKQSYRAMVGYSTRKNPKTGTSSLRYWHFALEARPIRYPVLAYAMKPHVAFSTNGADLWECKKRMASARQSQCKNWWNDEWRDRTLAAVNFLADEDGVIRFRLSSDVSLSISPQPMMFDSPVSYQDPQSRISEEDSPDDYADNSLEEDDDPYEDDRSGG